MPTPRTELDTRFSEPGAQPTSWEDTLEAIAQAEIFWISTVREDGRPHVTPLVAVWLDDALRLDAVIEGEAAASRTRSSSSGSPRRGRRSGTADGKQGRRRTA